MWPSSVGDIPSIMVIERHVWAFLHEKMPDAFLPVPGIDVDIGKGSVMKNAWGTNGKPSMDELQCVDFSVIVRAEFD